MPKLIYNLYSAAQPIITNVRILTLLGKSTTAGALAVAMVATSLWAHTTHAKAPEVALKGSDEKTEEKIVDGLTATERAAKIDAYFAQYNLPAAGYGKVFVDAADREGLDWRFVAAKAMIESTGGKFVPKKDPDNMFGWGCSDRAGTKCRDFASKDEAINEVTAHLAGNRPTTAKYYANKTLSQKMASYNSVNPKYQTLVYSVMNKISAMEVSKPDTATLLAMK